MSLLTAAAVLHGLCAVLVRRYEDAAPWYIHELCSTVCTGEIKAGRVERRRRAVRAVKDLRRELEVLLGVSEVSCFRFIAFLGWACDDPSVGVMSGGI